MKRLLISQAALDDPPHVASLLKTMLDEHGVVVIQRLEDALSLKPGSLVAAVCDDAPLAERLNDPDYEERTPMESTHRITFQITVADDALDRQRTAYIEANPDDEDLDNFYGHPEEWASLLDLVDAHKDGVILRSEIVKADIDVRQSWDPLGRKRKWWQIWKA